MASRVGVAGGHDRDVVPEVSGDLRGKRHVGEATRLDDDEHVGERGDDAPGREEAPALRFDETRAGTPKRLSHGRGSAGAGEPAG